MRWARHQFIVTATFPTVNCQWHMWDTTLHTGNQETREKDFGPAPSTEQFPVADVNIRKCDTDPFNTPPEEGWRAAHKQHI